MGKAKRAPQSRSRVGTAAESAPWPTLVWGPLSRTSVLYSVSSPPFGLVSFFVRPDGRFSVPTCPGPGKPRADAVKDGPFGPPPGAARSVLDGGEHGVTLTWSGLRRLTVAVYARRPDGEP